MAGRATRLRVVLHQRRSARRRAALRQRAADPAPDPGTRTDPPETARRQPHGRTPAPGRGRPRGQSLCHPPALDASRRCAARTPAAGPAGLGREDRRRRAVAAGRRLQRQRRCAATGRAARRLRRQLRQPERHQGPPSRQHLEPEVQPAQTHRPCVLPARALRTGEQPHPVPDARCQRHMGLGPFRPGQYLAPGAQRQRRRAAPVGRPRAGAGPPRRVAGAGDDPGREIPDAAQLLRPGQGRRSAAARRARLGRLRAGDRTPGHRRATAGRCRRRRDQPRQRAPRRPRHRAAVRPGHRRHLEPRTGLRRRRDDGPRSLAAGLQRAAGRQRQPATRSAQRPQLRVRRRRSAASRGDGRRVDPRRAEPARGVDDEALRDERPGDRAQHPQRRHRRAGHARIGPAGVRAGAADRRARLGDVFLQPHQRHLRLRARLPAQPGAEAGMEIPRLRDVRLGRRAQRLQGGAGRAGPAIGRRSVRQGGVLRPTAAPGGGQRHGAAGAAGRHGAAHPARVHRHR